MTDEAPWTKLKQDGVLKAIDLVREALADSGSQGAGPADGLAEFISQVKNFDTLMEQNVGLLQLARMLVERIESEHGVSAHDTLLDVSNEVKKKPLV